MAFTIKQIANICKADFISAYKKEECINYLLTDSRSIVIADNCLFIALVSKYNDGHKYIEALYKKGIKNFIVSKNIELIDESGSIIKDVNIILVDNTLDALQKITSEHRKGFSYPLLTITGSNGKTIVKEWLYQLLSTDIKIIRNPKSYNSQIGVPLSVWNMDKDYDLAIFEAGISLPGEMEQLELILHPDIGIFTNIGAAHNENFINKLHKTGEKLKLFANTKTLIYCSDYPEISEQLVKSGLHKKMELFSWSRKNKDLITVKQVLKNNSYTTISIEYNNINFDFSIPFTDEASVENAIHCAAFMLYYKYDKEIIQQRMKLLIPVAMRMELKEGINNCLIINDYYNSDINSLGIALEFLANQSRYDKKTVILSDILQSGKNEESLYSEVATLVHTKKITKFIGIGETISRHKEKFKVDKYFYKTTEEFINSYPFISFNNESILLKGARFFKFEMISNIIEQKSHSTVLEINLNSLIHNYNYYKSQLQAGTKIIAMVKAFSYGCGSYEIAQSLQFHNVNYLAVAYTDEGVELRKAGISCPIIVMNPQENSFDAIFKYNLQPEIYNFRILNILLKNLKHYMLNYENAISIHIKLDTGMHRLGFEEKDIDELINILKNNRQLRVESVFSHLAAAYDNTKDDFTLKQIELFTLLSERVIEGLAYPILRHILSSVGIIRFPQAAFDMVRPGIGLYGIPSTDKEKKELLNVGTLKTVIYQVKTIKKGESIGYGADCIVNRETKIGIIPVGYADGLSRRLSNGKGKLFVNGCIVPVIGKICMDMTFIDITDIKAEESDEVIIFGKDYPISNIAEQLGTIPYEVLTNVSRRVKRVFFKE